MNKLRWSCKVWSKKIINEWKNITKNKIHFINGLQVKAIDTYIFTIFWDKLFSYMWLTTIDMKWNTFIEQKVIALICEESGPQKL
jgi:hypothetical protein